MPVMEEATTKTEWKAPRLYSAEERAKAVAGYRGSGLSAWRYAEQAGVNYWGLKRWLAEAGRGGLVGGKPRLVAVRVKEAASVGREGQIEIVLGDGTVVKVPAGMMAPRIGELIQAVRKAC
jgi:transposase-like protein